MKQFQHQMPMRKGFQFMGKRFTCTEKWKKPFIKSLKPSYKLLWLYILDDCDNAGIWQVDIEVAELRVGEKLNITEALHFFSDKIVLLEDGSKWFIPSFVEFQYPSGLSENNRAHTNILKSLYKYESQIKPLAKVAQAPYKPLEHLAHGAMDMDKEQDMDMEQDKEQEQDKDTMPKIQILLPFESDEFKNSWELWKDYKSKEFKFKYKTPQSEQASLMQLAKMANGSEDNAKKIINQSMANGWKGFFELKNNENANTKTYQARTSNQVTNEQLNESLAKRFGGGQYRASVQ